MLDTVVISGEVVSCNVVCGTLVGASVFKFMCYVFNVMCLCLMLCEPIC